MIEALVGVLLIWWQVSRWMTLTQNLSACWKWGECFSKEFDDTYLSL